MEEGATISRRFPLVQGSKTRMIDDFSISGVNDSCATFNKVDLHVVDTFSSVVQRFFSCCQAVGANSLLEGETYDLKSAYRQVPIRADHLKYGYFSVFNVDLASPPPLKESAQSGMELVFMLTGWEFARTGKICG